MENLHFKSVVLGTMISAASCSVFAGDVALVPFVGIDGQWRHMPFAKGFDQENVKKHYAQANPYIWS
jgi:hypothetical protein